MGKSRNSTTNRSPRKSGRSSGSKRTRDSSGTPPKKRTRSQTEERDLVQMTVAMERSSGKQNKKTPNQGKRSKTNEQIQVTIPSEGKGEARSVSIQTNTVNEQDQPMSGVKKMADELSETSDSGENSSSNSNVRPMQVEVNVIADDLDKFSADEDSSQPERSPDEQDNDIAEALKLLRGNAKVTKLFRTLVADEIKQQQGTSKESSGEQTVSTPSNQHRPKPIAHKSLSLDTVYTPALPFNKNVIRPIDRDFQPEVPMIEGSLNRTLGANLTHPKKRPLTILSMDLGNDKDTVDINKEISGIGR